MWCLLLLFLGGTFGYPSCRKTLKMPCTWPSAVPTNCPYPKSTLFTSISFFNQASYPLTHADTWFPSWASNDNMYSSWTDGLVYTPGTHKEVRCYSSLKQRADTGTAVLEGDYPLNMTVTPLGCVRQPANATDYTGRYPSANLVYDGVWYYGTYGLANLGRCKNWCVMGPFISFRTSTDYGKSWVLNKTLNVTNNMFGEPIGQPIKMGAPHFVDFGKNMEHSPDGKAYMVASGCNHNPPLVNCSWMSGDAVYMARFRPQKNNPQAINDKHNWEFYGQNGTWVSSVDSARAIATWEGKTGVTTMTYNPILKKYFLVISTPDHGLHLKYPYDTYVLESDNLTGPFSMVTYMQEFGGQAYFANIPSKFWNSTGKGGWLMYSANWDDVRRIVDPSKSRYGLCLAEFTMA
eukprot:TRINITY_DN65748_c6_g6_i1.p1 TRINITY_DN65748_c6_g6~~TRINITY_DN65748_c6_g6_i1.p1  ORF type:complete len:405 (+),score=2.05 TRINITY_DN65748_c6_g6_i1:14-1228(+)